MLKNFYLAILIHWLKSVHLITFIIYFDEDKMLINSSIYTNIVRERGN